MFRPNPFTLKALNANTNISLKIGSHITNTNNPHNVTKTQVGLNNVDNTTDADKPISTATQNALNNKLEASDIVNKLDKNGYTGNITVVTDVDFTNETVTTKTISYVDGQITDIS